METKIKQTEYAVKVISALSELFNENSEFFIDKEDFKDEENLTAFLNAVANTAPTVMYNRLTGESANTLELNHIANKLCFKYLTK